MKLKLYSRLLGLILLAACNKVAEPVTPDFDVTVTQPTNKAGKEIRFSFEGSADMISFYSGIAPNDYDFRAGREINIAGQGVNLGFQSAFTGGTQANQLSVLVSTDFNGNYDDFNNVKAATWMDVTSRFALGTNATFLASGVKDISDLTVAGKPLYIAFKYVTKPQSAQANNGVANLVRQWLIQSFLVSSKATFNGSPLTVVNQASAGFRIVDQNKVNAPARSSVALTRITLWGNLYKDPVDPRFDPTNPIYVKTSPSYDREAVYVPYDPNSPYNDYPSENWAISKPINVNKVDLGPDWAVAVKGKDTQPKDFGYTYSKAGTYKAYFIATNSTITGTKQVIKPVDVIVEP